MGFVLEEIPGAGEYSAEVRSESFYLRGTFDSQASDSSEPPRHAIVVYPDRLDRGTVGGTCEILLEDIPKIRAVLDAVEEESHR